MKLDLRDTLAIKTAMILASNKENYEAYNKILTKAKNKPYNLTTSEEFIPILEYGLKATYGSAIELILLFAIAWFLHILIPVIVILATFATLRSIAGAGGCHMDTFYKCLISTTFTFIVLGKIVSLIDMNWIINKGDLLQITTYVFMVSLYLVFVYAPRDTSTKIINNKKEIEKFKWQSMKYVSFIYIVMIALIFFNQQLIALSMLAGLIFEIFTITPLGVKSFHSVRDIINGIYKSNTEEIEVEV